CWAKATNVRFTALSMSSTHMNTMIALRRINTPTTPITNNTAEKKSDSASIVLSSGPLFAEDDGADDRGEQQNARHFEGEQVFVEQRTGQRRDRALGLDLLGREALREREIDRCLRLRQREDLRENREAHGAGRDPPPEPARVRRSFRASKVQEHD